MKQISLGKESHTSAPIHLNPERLLDTRMLVMASSGGGKSWALRKLVESLHGQVQIIVLDIEGEFGTLRSHYPFVVAGKGGDVAADPRYAEVLARKLLELKADTICDLYELKQHERIRFVRLFLESMVNAPKEFWHPVVVVLDEAHIFAPEKGSAESLGAVIDMASRGRKRGFCLVAATQRLSKLHKDVAAECQNKMIGLANLGLDRKRAAEELGFTEKAEILAMRDLEPGQFFGVGPAFDFRGVHKVTVGKVITQHPKSGAGRLNVHTPAPSAKVKAMLSKLADLPQETEAREKTMAGLQTRIRELERKLIEANVKTDVVTPSPIELRKIEERAIELGRAEQRKADFDAVMVFKKRLKEVLESANFDLNEDLLKLTPKISDPNAALKQKMLERVPMVPLSSPGLKQVLKPAAVKAGLTEDNTLGKCERSILAFLCLKPGEFFAKQTIGAMSGYRVGGSFNNAIGRLTSMGYLDRSHGQIALRMDAEVGDLVQGYAHTLEDWISKLGKCEREIYQLMLGKPGVSFTKEALADHTNYKVGGSFNNALGRLNTLGLIVRERGGLISLNPDLPGVWTPNLG
jgi:hypothetical protein